MKYTIKQIESFKVAGMITTISLTNKDNPVFSNRSYQTDELEEIAKVHTKNVMEDNLLGIFIKPWQNNDFYYLVGYETELSEHADFKILKVPSSSWAIFPICGKMPEELLKVREYISNYFELDSGLHLNNKLELEVFIDTSSDTNYCAELWIPIE